VITAALDGTTPVLPGGAAHTWPASKEHLAPTSAQQRPSWTSSFVQSRMLFKAQTDAATENVTLSGRQLLNTWEWHLVVWIPGNTAGENLPSTFSLLHFCFQLDTCSPSHVDNVDAAGPPCSASLNHDESPFSGCSAQSPVIIIWHNAEVGAAMPSSQQAVAPTASPSSVAPTVVGTSVGT
jgi:hypothetical protein